MEKLTIILQELEQGRISAVNAEEQVLRLFGGGRSVSHKEREEIERQQWLKSAEAEWKTGSKLSAVKYVRYAYDYLDLMNAKAYCEKHFG